MISAATLMLRRRLGLTDGELVGYQATTALYRDHAVEQPWPGEACKLGKVMS